MLRVLIIDDEKNIRITLQVCLEQMGCEVVAVGAFEHALAAVAQQSFDVAFLDLRLREANGLDLLPKLLANNPNLGVIVLTAYATFETAVEAIRRGAVDFLPKPFTPAQIRHLIEKFEEHRSTRWRLEELDQELRQSVPDVDLETHSPKMRAALEVIAQVARADATVLLRGENGTGKGVLARALHVQSKRKARPFVVVNCPTLSEELLASELFGHAKGAFTGAVSDQPGKVEAAQGGTLFLDEVGEISPALQVKLFAIPAGKAVRANRRKPLSASRRAGGRGDQSRPGSRRSLRAFSRRFAVSLERGRSDSPAAPRAPGGSVALGSSVFGVLCSERSGVRRSRSRRRPKRFCSAIPGRAMCASCATRSSEP